MNTEPKIDTPHPAAKDMHEAIRLPRTLMGKTAAMREAGEMYLPREPAESLEAYKDRLKRSVLFNGFGKTVEDMRGRVFSKEVILNEDVPSQIVEWAENIDLAGRNFTVFAAHVFDQALVDGVAYILADTPAATGEDATLATQGRPYLVQVKAEDLIGWTHVPGPEGEPVLTSLRFYETVEEQVDAYHSRVIKQIRVLLPLSYEIWRRVKNNGREEWTLYASGARDLEAIPLAIVYLNRTGFMTGSPPLQDLADLNVAHWQSASDQRQILHSARVPILFGSGFPEDIPIVISASMMTRASDPAAKLAWVEHSGASITAGRDDLKDLEMRMQAMGLQLLVDQSGRTATGESRDDAKENSRLAQFVDALKDGLEMALGWMAVLGGIGADPMMAGGSITLNKDFGIDAAGIEDIRGINELYKGGLLSQETALYELKRRGFLADDVDVDEELDALADEKLEAIENEQAMMDAQVGTSSGTVGV